MPRNGYNPGRYTAYLTSIDEAIRKAGGDPARPEATLGGMRGTRTSIVSTVVQKRLKSSAVSVVGVYGHGDGLRDADFAHAIGAHPSDVIVLHFDTWGHPSISPQLRVERMRGWLQQAIWLASASHVFVAGCRPGDEPFVMREFGGRIRFTSTGYKLWPAKRAML